MRHIRGIFFLCLILTAPLCAQVYTKAPFITDVTWRQVQPYLLPHDHPLKERLDALFSKGRPLASGEALRKAGFKFHNRPGKFMIVARHPKLKGYLVKTYLDNQRLHEGEWFQWIKRIQGADLIRESIAKHNYQPLMKVPQKWIYALPPKTLAAPSANCFPKQLILIVEDMEVVKPGKNFAKYRFMMNETILEALFFVLKENYLFDSMYLDNIPFCKDHKIAFIDTEHYGSANAQKPMNYDQMLPRLSKKMQIHWRRLVAKYK